jgi:Tol biopolymer transport system component
LHAWSADGARLALISGRGGIESVWVIDADGQGARRLTAEASLNPSWK